MKVTVLGSGGSTGTPAVELGWGACDSNNPKNRRLRPGLYVQKEDNSILVDTGPDLREQLLANKITQADAVIYTHAHADHTHGLNDVRSLNRLMNKALPAYMSVETHQQLSESFPWVFEEIPENKNFYKPTLEPKIITSNEYRTIADIDCQFFEQSHGFSTSYGILFDKKFAFTTDVVAMSDEALKAYENVEHWMVGMIGFKPHPTHADYDTIKKWADRIQPKHIWITHIGLNLDHNELIEQLPDNMQPTYDGHIITIE
ncbi:MAG: MBL fold metallo-hydrolase [Alphaproteobacteria bacterium]